MEYLEIPREYRRERWCDRKFLRPQLTTSSVNGVQALLPVSHKVGVSLGAFSGTGGCLAETQIVKTLTLDCASNSCDDPKKIFDSTKRQPHDLARVKS